jgi:hypothetical protein
VSILAVSAVIAAIISFLGTIRDFGSFHASLLTGSPGGAYYILGLQLAQRAKVDRNRLDIVATAGSLENVSRLIAEDGSAERGDGTAPELKSERQLLDSVADLRAALKDVFLLTPPDTPDLDSGLSRALRQSSAAALGLPAQRSQGAPTMSHLTLAESAQEPNRDGDQCRARPQSGRDGAQADNKDPQAETDNSGRDHIGERSFHWCDPKANWPLVGRIKDQPDSQNTPGRFGRHPFVTQSWPNSVILNRTCPAKRAGLFVASSRRALAGYSAPF